MYKGTFSTFTCIVSVIILMVLCIHTDGL